MAILARPTFSNLLETGVIYRDDNLHRLALLPPNSIDLIYLDPPFFSNRTYEVIWGDEAEVRSFQDRWEGGIHHYVGWMKERALEMWRVLRPTGSLYLHCDWHAAHYLKVMLDGVFGQQRFRNEIVWKRTGAHSSAKKYAPIHDTILYYTKSDSYVWNAPRTPYAPEYLNKYYRFDDGDGRLYWRNSLTAAGIRHGSSGRPWRGIDVSATGQHWKFTVERLDELDARGQIYWPPRGGFPQIKRYRDGLKGKAVADIWDDIDRINPVGSERLGYPTQKPEALLERLIEVSSNGGDVVLDPFAGCGTSTVVADRLHRRWIGIDISTTACNLMKRRLAKVGVQNVKIIGLPTSLDDLKALKPFEFQNWVVERINGIQSPRKSGDLGIDGWTFMLHDPVQIKQSEGVGRNVIDNFETAIRRAEKNRGFVFAFSFTRNAYEEVARIQAEGLRVALVGVDDLLFRPDEVFRLMGHDTGAPDPVFAPMPVFEPRRHSAEELFESQAAGD